MFSLLFYIKSNAYLSISGNVPFGELYHIPIFFAMSCILSGITASKVHIPFGWSNGNASFGYTPCPKPYLSSFALFSHILQTLP